MSDETFEQIGEAADTLDNLSAALTLPMPDSFHLEAIRSALPEVSKKIKKAIIAETGENPWEDWGFDPDAE